MRRARISRTNAILNASVIVVVALAVTACRSTTPAGAADQAPRRAMQREAKPSGDRLGYAEIQSVQVADTYEAVSRLRPQFLRRHSVAAPTVEEGQPVIYLDGIRQGGLEMLRSIPVKAVFEIRYLSATAANAEFGRLHRGGVISVQTSP